MLYCMPAHTCYASLVVAYLWRVKMYQEVEKLIDIHEYAIGDLDTIHQDQE